MSDRGNPGANDDEMWIRKAGSLRRFVLERDVDETGVSGTGIVAEGVEFSDGVVSLHWMGGWPSSVVWYESGMSAVIAVHGHSGSTRIVYWDEPEPPRPWAGQ